MKATEILMQEHRVIERVLGAVEAAATSVEEGKAVRPGFFLEAADFIKNFADGCHHHKEEGVLFEVMVQCGLPRHAGPIAVMLMEHDQGRDFTKGMVEAAQRLQGGDATARAPLVANAMGYVNLLRQHIAKEDGVLFPMADQVIPPARHEQVAADFARVEHEKSGSGVHEKYLALAGKLEEEVRAG